MKDIANFYDIIIAIGISSVPLLISVIVAHVIKKINLWKPMLESYKPIFMDMLDSMRDLTQELKLSREENRMQHESMRQENKMQYDNLNEQIKNLNRTYR